MKHQNLPAPGGYRIFLPTLVAVIFFVLYWECKQRQQDIKDRLEVKTWPTVN